MSNNISSSAPNWLRNLGIQSWLFIGLVLASVVILAVMATLNQIVTSLIISLLLAILSRPLVDWLEHHKVPRSLGTVLTMAFILIVLIGLIVIVVKGFWQQAPEISYQLRVGWVNLQASLLQFNIELPSASETSAALTDALPAIFEGLFGFLGSTLSTVIGFFVGLYFSIFSLFFFLRDTDQIEAWIAHRINRSPEVGTTIVKDAGQTVLIYFRGTGLTALITSVVVAIALLILNVPLVGSILILYFFTSFIPYLGAWIAGAFAVLIALGAGGVQTALIILTAVIVSNGVLQSVVSSWALGSMLKIHPLVIFLVTIVAGMVGGVLLMILAVPLTAITLQVGVRLRQEDSVVDDLSNADE
jgi:predicted PurR-regulated permease PerM